MVKSLCLFIIMSCRHFITGFDCCSTECGRFCIPIVSRHHQINFFFRLCSGLNPILGIEIRYLLVFISGEHCALECFGSKISVCCVW